MRWFGWFRRKRTAGAGEQSGGAPLAMIGGRLRTKGIPYVLPRDLEELNRLDFQHYLLRQAFGGNYAAPIDRPRDILDVGTGTARWAMEVAALFPGAKVVGLDVNPPPADEEASLGAGLDRRPSNYSFAPGNVLEGLPFPDGSFDFVHMRLLILAIPHDRWPFVVNELARVTRRGGWVESVETGALEQGGPAMDLIMEWITTLLARRGIDFTDGPRVGDLLRSAGLAQVATHRIALPFGEYGGRIGKLLATDFFTGMKGYGGLLEAQGVTAAQQFDQAVAAAREHTASPDVHCVSPFYIAFGQRTR